MKEAPSKYPQNASMSQLPKKKGGSPFDYLHCLYKLSARLLICPVPPFLLFPLLSAKISFKCFLVLHFLNCSPCPSVLSSPSDTVKLLTSSSSANMAYLGSRCPRVLESNMSEKQWKLEHWSIPKAVHMQQIFI
ncbi:hypothetical protein ES288_A09G019400v1 [Gossypium darwinii]|uniref:Uncharacterized protein n=1 Tax=Gossypium darwinii TaxID=34276 RepID=A0A5D2F4R0_GOSDA|nr:hypothetical protein ES288_A09G019400v1 [Gossypium darwinii]